MKDVFITSTLKKERNKKYNSNLCAKIEEKGLACYLPQRDTHQGGSDYNKYTENIKGIINSRYVISVGVNHSINWGLETGYAFGSGKKIILLTEKDCYTPVMSLGMYANIINVISLDNIDEYIDELANILKN